MGKGRVMCTLKTTFTALLLITVSAFAQQSQPVQSTQPAGQPTISISAPAAQPAAPQPTPVQAVAAQAQQVQTAPTTLDQRSEEHTSELQSRGHLVCRLLLEKKKQ